MSAPGRPELRRLVRLRVGTTEEKTPRHVEGVVVLHRPLPPQGVARKAMLIRDQVAAHRRWKLIIVVDVGERDAPESRDPIVGVDVGWRIRPDGGLRVACACTEEGEPTYLTLPPRVVTAFEKADSLRAIRDREFNLNRAALWAWRQEWKDTLPAWFLEATATLPQWRARGRLAALVLRWRADPFPDDATAYDALEAWRENDKHLWEWEANERRNASARRREAFRLFALALARTAGTVALEEFDVRKVTGTEEELDRAARMRAIGAVGALRETIRQTCAREGVDVKKVDARDTTVTCARCGTKVAFDARTEVRATCPTCGAEWDQDENAARNLAYIAATGHLRQPPAPPASAVGVKA